MTKNILVEVVNFIQSDNSLPFELLDIEKLVLINLASHKGEKGIFPKVQTIAKETQKGYSSIKRATRSLEDKDLITKQYGRCKAVTYEIKLSTIRNLYGSSVSLCMAHGRANERLTDEPNTINNKNNNKESKARKRRATPLSDDFVINQNDIQKARELGLTEDEANLELDKFFHHYQGEGIEKADWHQVLQGWLVRAADYKQRQASKRDGVKSTVPWTKPDPARNAVDYVKGGLSNGLGSKE